MSTNDTLLDTPSSRNPLSFRGVRFRALDAELGEAGITGACRDLIVGVAREFGSRWTRITFDEFHRVTGIRSHRTLADHIPTALAGEWIERRPDPKGSKSFEYRTAGRFHSRRPKAVA